MTAELPSWTDYTVTADDEAVRYLTDAGAALGGLRIMDLGDGHAALDVEAFRALARQPEDATVSIEVAGELTAEKRHLVWLAGVSYPLEPSFGTGVSAERSRELEEGSRELEEGMTYGNGTHPAGESGPVLSREDAREVSEALRDLLGGIGREAGLWKLAPAADAEVPTPPSEIRCLTTRAALDAITASEGRVPPGTVRAAAMRTTADGFGAWVEWLRDITPVTLAAFRSEDGHTLTIALWTEVREQVLSAVAAYNEDMAGRDWLLGESG